MPLITFRRLLPVACVVAAGSALAQARPAPDPLDASAAVPLLMHRSGLADYRRLDTDPALPWRQANDTVARVGGWRTYLRQASQPEPAAAPPATTPPAPPAHMKH